MNEELLIRFLSHTCSVDEYKKVDEWVSLDKSNADWLFDMERIWSFKDELRFSDKQEIEKAYHEFISRIGINKTKKVGMYVYASIKYAAIVILVSLLSVNLYKLYDKTADSLNVVEVPRGQRVSLTLSDGTKVALNSDTRFTYPGKFSKNIREVCLNGEGYFEVAHDVKKPFVVNSDLIHVRVLGTKFDMRTYSEESSAVTLLSGKVEVEAISGGDKLILKPNEQITYSKENGFLFTRNMDVNIAKSWTRGETAFIAQRLDRICCDLQRKYDVKIDIVDPQLAASLFTCHFKESTTIEQVLTLLKETRQLDFSFNSDNNIIIYKPKK